jgi:hypothetical protein
MRGRGFILAIACAVGITAAPAWAGDLCMESSVFGPTLVAKNFGIPGKNKCKPIHGFLDDSMVAGTACTTSDGTILRVHFTIHLANSNDAALGACNFGLPSLNGNCRLKLLSSSNTIQSFADPAAFASKCTGETVD